MTEETTEETNDSNQIPTTPDETERPKFSQRVWAYFKTLYSPQTLKERGLWWSIGLFIITVGVLLFFLSIYWSSEPDTFDIKAAAEARVKERGEKMVTGYITTNTLIEVVSRGLLDKPGGYFSNDKLPPSTNFFDAYWFMDNIPNWEFGVLVQVRDFSEALRNHISRSQSSGREQEDLAKADPKFKIDNDSWLMPPAEQVYREGINLLESYLKKLTSERQADAQFYARADNLATWLQTVEQRLGDLSQRLSDSVGEERLNVDLAGDPSAKQSTVSPTALREKTPWLEIDDIFYHVRGTCWALMHILQAVEIDFREVLARKGAVVSLQQIIRELNATQKTLWSPIVLNGSEFGLFANHSLILSSYVTRAQTGIARLVFLLREG